MSTRTLHPLADAYLDRLGTPEEIAEAEGPRPAPRPDKRGNQEWAAIILLLFGGFVFGIGWIAGLILLWGSKAWTTRDKLIGSLLWPGGLGGVAIALPAFLLSDATVCPPSGCSEETTGDMLGLVGVIVAIAVPFMTAFYLARRAR